jgi:nucleoside-diphosphate-sugar epimerase
MGTGADPGGDLGKTLITGGGGFVGKAVAERCLAAGLETFIVGRNHYPDLARRGAHCIVGNINDRKFTDKALAGMNTVFHVAALAGIWGPWHDYYTTNVVGTENVISSCKKNKVATLVHTSTPSVVFNRESIGGGDERLPYAESPLCSYARSKIMAERAVLSANSDSLKTCALRPHLVWGPGDPHLIPRLVERGRQGRLRQVVEGDNLVDISCRYCDWSRKTLFYQPGRTG